MADDHGVSKYWDGPYSPEQFGVAVLAETEASGAAEDCTAEVSGARAQPAPASHAAGNIVEKKSDETIIDEVAGFVRRFVFLADKSLYLLVASWIFGTHLHKQFEFSGYLFAHSPERQSGKTTLLDILNLLVYKSTGLQVSPTEAVIFRTAEDQTQLFDEVDSWKNGESLRDVLNAGYKKGGVVTRCDRSKAGAYKPISFKVFAPRALAGIGMSTLPSTTLDRTFALSMVRQKKSEKRERFRERTKGSEARELKKRIEDWSQKNERTVADCYEKRKFTYLEFFGDRTIDIAEPLAAIVEVAYSGHPREQQARETLVHAIASARKEQQAPSREHLVLKCLLELCAVEDPLIGNAVELAAMCANSEEPIEESLISQTLRKYGFKTKSSRKQGVGDPRYRYTLPRAELQDLVDRWVGETTEGD